MDLLNVATPSLSTSTSARSVRSINDRSMEETSLALSYAEDRPLSKESLKTLLRGHYFIKYQKNGHRSVRRIYFNDSLQKLILEKDRSNSKFIFTTDILAVEFGFSNQLTAVLLKGDYNHKVYGFRLITRKRLIELSSNSRAEREQWVDSVNMLAEVVKEWSSHIGLRKYWDTLTTISQSEQDISDLLECQRNAKKEISMISIQRNELEKEVIEGLINEMILALEVKEANLAMLMVKRQEEAVDAENRLLRQKQENLQNSLHIKNKEIAMLSDSVKTAEKQLYGTLVFNQTHILSKIWKNIIEFLSFNDLLALQEVSLFFKDQVAKAFITKSVWRRMGIVSLRPRKISWRMYIRNFYGMRVGGMGHEVFPEIMEEISKDVNRGLVDHQQEVEEVLIGLCALNPDVGYCQGMQLVTHFLLGILRDTDEVLGTLMSLLRPPFYLGELWKNGFSRLKLGIFQLEFLLKLKLPYLAKHFKDLDINLDVIVTPWLLTVFTHLLGQQGVPIEVVQWIWDFFLVQGWPALLSTCLALFYLSQESVLGENLETTLHRFSNNMPFETVVKFIPKFEIEPSLLDDLERAFYLQTNIY